MLDRLPAFSYVLPLRMSGDERTRCELARYLVRLSKYCDDVIVVDGSAPEVFADNGRAWAARIRHLAPDPEHASLMGKVPGVLTGIDAARNEAVVLADDDVRYEIPELMRMLELLNRYDLVRPQNYFSPQPWHALWDTSRTLINRATGHDFPGTLGLRRSTLQSIGGYDGNVLFENLELIRTIEANAGMIASPLDLYVRRLPPATAHFVGQRTRQAYDDFAIPPRMAVWLSVLPILAFSLIRRRPRRVLVLAGGSILIAESGRRRAGGATVFPFVSSLLAPFWVLERGICSWLAVLQRLRYGGVRYGDSTIPLAAHSRHYLAGLAAARISK